MKRTYKTCVNLNRIFILIVQSNILNMEYFEIFLTLGVKMIINDELIRNFYFDFSIVPTHISYIANLFTMNVELV